MYVTNPTTNRAADKPRIPLSLTLPVKEHATKIIAPTKIKINPRFFNKPFICVYFNRLLYFSILCHKETHNSLTSEIIFAKNPYFNKEWKMRNEK